MIKYFVTWNFRGTWPSVEMLHGYMIRWRLGTPGLQEASAVKKFVDFQSSIRGF